MVVGGGISGIQAALDLATSGFKVYPGREGADHRRQDGPARQDLPHQRLLDVHRVAPKFIECDRHPNIEILTYTEVDRVEGEAGDFKVTLIRKPRYISEDKCTGCTTCVEYCPVKVPDPFNQEICRRTRPSTSTSPRPSRSSPTSTRAASTSRRRSARICDGVCKNNAIDLSQTAGEGRDQGRGDRPVARATSRSTPGCGATTATAGCRTSSPASTSSGCCAPPGRTRARSCAPPTRSTRTGSPGSTASARGR